MDGWLVRGGSWAQIAAALAGRLDLEGSALRHRALLRRRGIGGAAQLLRLALVYGGTDLSLRGTAAWARLAGVADLSDVALLYRLQGSTAWLGWLLQELLSREVGPLAAAVTAPGWRLRLIDGTAIARPGGAPGIAWRLHAGFDLAARRFDRLQLTTGKESESLERFAAQPGEILIADRFYAKARGIRHVLAQGAHVIIRRGLTSCRLHDAGGQALNASSILALAASGTSDGGLVDMPVLLPAADGSEPVPARLIIARKPPEAAASARSRAERKARRQHYRAGARQIEAADYMMVMTSLPSEAMAATQILALYRLRWQIEIAFKRLKSLAGLADLQAREERLARTAIFAKLILAVLGESLLGHVLALSPWSETVDLAADHAAA